MGVSQKRRLIQIVHGALNIQVPLALFLFAFRGALKQKDLNLLLNIRPERIASSSSARRNPPPPPGALNSEVEVKRIFYERLLVQLPN